MQYLYKITKEMEVKLHTLLAEVQELKNKAREIEEENVRLRKELADIYRTGLDKGMVAGQASCKRGF